MKTQTTKHMWFVQREKRVKPLDQNVMSLTPNTISLYISLFLIQMTYTLDK